MKPEQSDDAGWVALVTGANKGLGLETSRQLAIRGAKVFLGARDEARGTAAAGLLAAEGHDVEALIIDVTSREDISAAARQIETRAGRLDILVNNAGISPESAGGFTVPLDLDLFRQTFETNVFGTVAMIEAFLPLLLRSMHGRIVNMSSTVGSFQAQTNASSAYYGVVLPAYQASKASLNALTISQAKALKETNVKINSICPGWVRTDLGGASAPQSTEEGARIVVEMAMLPDSGPSGGFFSCDGAVAW